MKKAVLTVEVKNDVGSPYNQALVNVFDMSAALLASDVTDPSGVAVLQVPANVSVSVEAIVSGAHSNVWQGKVSASGGKLTWLGCVYLPTFISNAILK